MANHAQLITVFSSNRNFIQLRPSSLISTDGLSLPEVDQRFDFVVRRWAGDRDHVAGR